MISIDDISFNNFFCPTNMSKYSKTIILVLNIN